MRPSRALLLTALALSLVAATAQAADNKRSVSRDEKNATIHISYGRVIAIEETKLESNAASGAVLGGIIGLATTDKDKKAGDKLAGAAIGAGVGAGITRLLEGSNKAFSITVLRRDGTAVKVIQHKSEGFKVGDCVSVEEGTKSRMLPSPPGMCDGIPTPTPPPADSTRAAAATDSLAKAVAPVRDSVSMRLCAEAKELLLKAKTKDELELAMAKVKVICGE